MSYHHFVKSLHRYPSSISREWKGHLKEGSYSPSHAQKSYHMAKSHCGRKRMLERDHNLSNTVKHLFLDYQQSPEEIEGQLRLEYGKTVISYQTIYRAIYRGHFDDNSLSHRDLIVLVVVFVSTAIVERQVIRLFSCRKTNLIIGHEMKYSMGKVCT